MGYRLKAVQNDGTLISNLLTADGRRGVNVESIVDELNGPGSCSFNCPIELPDADLLHFGVEVQVLRDGSSTPVFWGVIVGESEDSATGQASFDAAGLLYYFGRRFWGKADRTNYLSNPEFESNLTGWTNNGTGLTSAAVTSSRILNTKSAQLDETAAGADAFLSQSQSITAGQPGLLLTVAAWYLIDDSAWIGGALGNRGLYVEAREAGVFQTNSFEPIDASTPREMWQRAETTIWIPPNKTWSIQVRLYAPGGTIWWDAVELVAMESYSPNFVGGGYEQTSIGRDIILHGQNPTYGKNDLNIGHSVTASGVIRLYTRQFADHGNLLADLAEFPSLENGFDFEIVLTATTRTFTTYYPRKGTPRATVLRVGAGEKVASVSRTFDGGSATSAVVMLGDGDGPDREEGAAIDPSLFAGKAFEEIISAPVGSPIDMLDELAAQELLDRSNPTALELRLRPGEQIGTVAVGDTYPVDISKGRLVVNDTFRVAWISLDCRRDALTLGMVPTQKVLPRSTEEQIIRHARRLFNLERRTRAQGRPHIDWWQDFGVSGPVVVGATSDWTAPVTSTAVYYYATLVTGSSSGSVTAALKKNGTTVGPTITLAAGTTVVEGGLAVGLIGGVDRLRLEVTGAGSGAAYLNVQVRGR